jgi:hypothetical protein
LLAGLVTFEGGLRSFRCSIRDHSQTGARISIPTGTIMPKIVYLIDVRGRVAHEAERVWATNKMAGLKFNRTLALDKLDDPSLTYLKIMMDALTVR